MYHTHVSYTCPDQGRERGAPPPPPTNQRNVKLTKFTSQNFQIDSHWTPFPSFGQHNYPPPPLWKIYLVPRMFYAYEIFLLRWVQKFCHFFIEEDNSQNMSVCENQLKQKSMLNLNIHIFLSFSFASGELKCCIIFVFYAVCCE